MTVEIFTESAYFECFVCPYNLSVTAGDLFLLCSCLGQTGICRGVYSKVEWYVLYDNVENKETTDGYERLWDVCYEAWKTDTIFSCLQET